MEERLLARREAPWQCPSPTVLGSGMGVFFFSPLLGPKTVIAEKKVFSKNFLLDFNLFHLCIEWALDSDWRSLRGMLVKVACPHCHLLWIPSDLIYLALFQCFSLGMVISIFFTFLSINGLRITFTTQKSVAGKEHSAGWTVQPFQTSWLAWKPLLSLFWKKWECWKLMLRLVIFCHSFLFSIC